MKIVNRLQCFLLCFILSVMLFACSNSSDNNNKNTTAAPTTGTEEKSSWQQSSEGSGGIMLPVFKEQANYKFIVYEVAAYPYKEGHIVIPELEKRANVKFDFQPMPVDGFPEKINIMLMADEYPDIIGGMDFPKITDMGLTGNKFLNIMEYLDDMPNLKALMEKNPIFKQYKADKDTMFALPICLASDKMLRGPLQYSYMVRKDLVDKHKMKLPENFDELYDFLKQFKQLYPESVPWTDRTGVDGLINKVATSWGMNILDNYLYDEQTGNFSLVFEDSRYKQVIEYLRKLYSEKLLDNELPLMTTEQWMGKMVTGTSFFTNDWYMRSQVITAAARASGNTEFLMNLILPPVGPGGKQVVKSDSFSRCFIAVSSQAKNPHELLKMFDYFYYSKDGAILNTLGVEGVSFRWTDEAKTRWEFIPYDDIPDSTDYTYYQKKFGVQIDLISGIKPEEFDIYQAGNVNDTYNYNLLKGHFIAPPPPMLFSLEETEKMQELGSLGSYVSQEIAKFVIGMNDMSKWDEFVKQCEAYGAKEFVKIYNDSWGRRK